MEQTLQTGEDMRKAIGELSDLVGTCQSNAAYASLMAEDLIEYFDILEKPEEERKAFAFFYFPENALRAQILQDYTHKTLTQATELEDQVRQLYQSLRQETK